jgi:hypothetical protein
MSEADREKVRIFLEKEFKIVDKYQAANFLVTAAQTFDTRLVAIGE